MSLQLLRQQTAAVVYGALCLRLSTALATVRALVLTAALLAAPFARAVDMGQVFSPKSSEVVPIPLIGIDPDSGTTLGVIAAWLHHNQDDQVDRIIAPDVLHNSYFGWGLRGRILEYPSADSQWALIAGAKQRVEHKLDAEYQTGITRAAAWSFAAGATDERSGTQRFYGIGNYTPESDQSNYTTEHVLLQAMVGRNFTPHWQLAYLVRFHSEDVTEGQLPQLPSITSMFPGLPGIGSHHELLNRLVLTYDSRDSPDIPTRGMQAVAYGGLSSRGGLFNDSLYSELGLDARGFVPLDPRTILAVHLALRELPSSHQLPFWAYSSIGGDASFVGGAQPLRGYGLNRFADVNSFSTSLELRRIITAMHVFATRIDLELAPFVDAGRVFSQLSTSPLSHLHDVLGFGVRGIARPFIVAYVDIGYGTEGTAAFSGINYIF
jgi:hypothetical protein